MDKIDGLELLYLRRIVMKRLDFLTRQLEKNRRFFRDTDDDILWQEKIGNLETEFMCLENTKSRINIQIAKKDFEKDEVKND